MYMMVSEVSLLLAIKLTIISRFRPQQVSIYHFSTEQFRVHIPAIFTLPAELTGEIYPYNDMHIQL
jgi:hypothetical protein